MKRPTSELVVVILATGIAVALFVMTIAATWALLGSVRTPDAARLVAVTQVLTGWGGGILGVIGAYVGYSFGVNKQDEQDH